MIWCSAFSLRERRWSGTAWRLNGNICLGHDKCMFWDGAFDVDVQKLFTSSAYFPRFVFLTAVSLRVFLRGNWRRFVGRFPTFQKVLVPPSSWWISNGYAIQENWFLLKIRQHHPSKLQKPNPTTRWRNPVHMFWILLDRTASPPVLWFTDGY